MEYKCIIIASEERRNAEHTVDYQQAQLDLELRWMG
jgi:hypothetical protein